MSVVNKTTLIVNYLPQTLTDLEFETMFSSIGQTKACKIVRNRSTGYSYGFGFVEYLSEADAANAIQSLNGIQLQHKVIKVAYSRQGERIKGANLYVRGLPNSYTAADLQQLFSMYGEIIQARVLSDTKTGTSRGVGFVLFATRDQAEAAINALNGVAPSGFLKPLEVHYAEDKNKDKQHAIVPPIAMQQMQVQSVLGGYPTGTYQSPFGVGYGMTAGGATAAGTSFQGPMRNRTSKQQRFNPIGGAAGASNTMAVNGNSASAQGHVLFVFNIGQETTEAQLCQLFAAYGSVVKTDVIRDPSTQVSRGFGFVTMPNYQEALNAIQYLNGYCFSAKPLQVSFKSAKSVKKP